MSTYIESHVRYHLTKEISLKNKHLYREPCTVAFYKLFLNTVTCYIEGLVRLYLTNKAEAYKEYFI